MKKRLRLAEDPVVAEVRSIRAELWREAGGTVAGLIRLVEQRKPSKRKPTAARSKRTPRRAR
ncbi:MAG: hypothetical protein JSU86_06495 [Phycisphaerales bacterium]|nr:MAG: hypothetical protein JSU86_06495 [Phycisphaerales bacterium]